MTIDAIKLGMLNGIQPIKAPTAPAAGQATPANGESFGQMLTQAVKDLDGVQTDADKQIQGLVLGKDGVTPHGAMIALEKADMAFQLMNNIRTKIVRAYEEVMRTQV